MSYPGPLATESSDGELCRPPAAGAVLVETGILDNNALAIVVAALFLPFLAEALAMGFGFWSGDGL
jgi:hypothetical protein